ncbi:NAD(P)-dependent oxidoreductase [Mycolicibacterium iranicum]|uniref:NAD(P)-dependent oxidoreductase n=1 Tax=Mycolicibacterium iranicum TaxID=912594 RepID=A0ABT4HHT5_MYCIR|nr:NAD(P)-dependent oxidoreductase [Mycolicibacterium iranicum]MCZ0729773.1 NAD(P)-dependent oxidoreductase [Mycolicibacterium iranicum]
MTHVGFVGVGRMGTPMVARLVGAGHQVTVLGRTEEKRTAITELGASAATTVADVVDGADVVAVCVFTDDQVRQLCLDGELVAMMAPGTSLVLHTTGSPRTAQTIASTHPHVDVIDAPVSGGPHDIAAGTVTLFVGGDDAALDRTQPVLASYGDPILRAGPTGAGQLVKLVNNTLFAAQIALVAEGVRLGSQLGVDEAPLLNALVHGSAQSRVLSMVAGAGSAEKFVSAVGEFITKDVTVVRDTVAGLGGDLGELDRLVRMVST